MKVWMEIWRLHWRAGGGGWPVMHESLHQPCLTVMKWRTWRWRRVRTQWGVAGWGESQSQLLRYDPTSSTTFTQLLHSHPVSFFGSFFPNIILFFYLISYFSPLSPKNSEQSRKRREIVQMRTKLVPQLAGLCACVCVSEIWGFSGCCFELWNTRQLPPVLLQL